MKNGKKAIARYMKICVEQKWYKCNEWEKCLEGEERAKEN